jgi:hypothetical protein
MAPVAAKHLEESAPCRLYVRGGAAAEAMTATVSLNNWEDRLQVEVIDALDDVPEAELHSARVLVVNDPEWARAMLARPAVSGQILLAVASRGDAVALPGGWFVHYDREADTATAVAGWAKDQRRQARRRLLAGPVRALGRMRRVAGALLYRLRRSLLF